MVDTEKASMLRDEIQSIRKSLMELNFTNGRNKATLKNAESNLREAYGLVQRGEAPIEEFNDFVASIDALRATIDGAEQMIARTEEMLESKIKELEPIKKAENSRDANAVFVCAVGFIGICFLVIKAISYISGLSMLTVLGWISGISFAIGTIVSICLILVSALWIIKEKIKRK